MIPQLRWIFSRIGAPVVAIILALLVGGVFILLIGGDPVQVYGRFFGETLGTWYGIGQVLFKATPMMLTGLSAAVAFRAGLFNIGAEGQLVIGAFAAAFVGFQGPQLPPALFIPIAMIAAMLGGAVWGLIPGFLKARFGAHEVINTIMMNFIAAALTNYLVTNLFAMPATIHTPFVSPNAELPRLDVLIPSFQGAPVNFALFVSIACCLALFFLLWKTRWGYELRVTGASLFAAHYAGISTSKMSISAMALAGALAGLGGVNFVLGYKHYFELGFSDGVGFIGIAVALMAKNNPLGIIFTSLFFGVLDYGGLTINTIVPKELVNILQAILIILVIVVGDRLQRLFSRFTSAMPAVADHD